MLNKAFHKYFLRSIKLILYLLFINLISSCSSSEINNDNSNYKINNFVLSQADSSGYNNFTINSPFATIHSNNDLIEIEDSILMIYPKNYNSYKIKSDKSNIINNQNRIESSGNVIIENLNNKNTLIFGDKLIWKIDESEILLKGNIRFTDKKSLIQAGKATFLQNENKMYISNIIKYVIYDKDNENNNTIPRIRIYADNATINNNTKILEFTSEGKQVKSIIRIND